MMADDDSDEAMDVAEDQEEGTTEVERRVFLPGRDNMEEGEELEMDKNAYKVYYKLMPEHSCMSFDIMRDSLGENRANTYPLSCVFVAGSAVSPSQVNQLQVIKLSNIRPIRSKMDSEAGSDSESDSDSDSEDLDSQPEVEMAGLRHNGIVNRVRVTQSGNACVAASWSEHGIVYLWDLKTPWNAVNDSLAMAEYMKQRESAPPIFTFNGHTQEGYAMDWNPHTSGMLLTGDCVGKMHLWRPQDNAADWQVSSTPYSSHTASVEDIQWSPTESTVFCSSSVDRSIRIWDIRAPPHKACQITSTDAHDADVNVIAWNRLNSSHILSGGDEGHLKVWDLRQFKRRGDVVATPLVCLRHHADPVTSVEWHPTESSVFAAAVSGKRAGDQLTLWDISVERGEADEASCGVEGTADLPPQLMFVHMGQEEVKELHWHMQMSGLLISTSADCFNIFRPVNM